MKEYLVDLVIDKTFSVWAASPQQAKERAIARAKNLYESYNALSIDGIEEVEEDTDFANEYKVCCYNIHGKCVEEYDIEADYSFGAAQAALDFCKGDYPFEAITKISVMINDEWEFFVVREGKVGIE